MSEGTRLSTAVEVAGMIRSVASTGGNAAVLRKGDDDRGSLILFVASRGVLRYRLERVLDIAGHYAWQASDIARDAESQKVADFLARRARFDADFWAVELDVPHPERFIAELAGKG